MTEEEAPRGDDEPVADEPFSIAPLYFASALLRIGAFGTGVAIQLDLSDLAGGRPHGLVIGTVGAAQAISEMVFAPVLARYADRLGRTRFLVGGPMLGAVGLLLVAMATQPRQIFAARLLEGIGAAAFVPTALGTIAAATTGNKLARARSSGAFEIATLVGITGGFAIGPIVWYYAGRWSFVVFAALYLASSAVVLRFIPRVPALQVSPLRAVVRAVLGPGPIRSFIPAWLAANALVLAFVANLPALLKRQSVPGQSLVHHFSEPSIAAILMTWAVLFIVGIALWTPVVARLGPAITMRRAVPGMWLICAGLLAINHLSLSHAPLLLPLVVLGIIGLAGFGPSALTYLAECSESFAADRSALMAFYTITLAGGGAIGAFLGGLAANWLYIDGLVLLGLALSVFAFFALGSVVRHERSREEALNPGSTGLQPRPESARR
ncbi:MAG: MFS transporter [Candidatus Dormibacteria bacterium]